MESGERSKSQIVNLVVRSRKLLARTQPDGYPLLTSSSSLLLFFFFPRRSGGDEELSAHQCVPDKVYGMCLLQSPSNGRIFQWPKPTWLDVRWEAGVFFSEKKSQENFLSFVVISAG